MALPSINIIRAGGGLGRREPSDDGICGIIMGGVATVATTSTAALPLNTSVKLQSTTDAKGYGLDSNYDTSNSVLVYYHIEEFFRMNPNGTLWLMLVGQAVTQTQMIDKAITTNAKKLITDANGEIKVLATALNPATYAPTITSGIDADVISAILKAQQLIDEEKGEQRPIDIIIEGRAFTGTATALLNVRSTSPIAPQVHVCLAQDNVKAASLALYAKHASVGTLLGTISLARVHENIGWVGKFRIDSPADNKFTMPGLSSSLPINSYTTTDLITLNDKGYIFLRKFNNVSGAYWNDSSSCTLSSDDYAYLENNRVINKAHRLVYAAYVPYQNAPLKVDSAGKLSPEVIAMYESVGNQILANMLNDGEISAGAIYIDPDQNVLSTSKLMIKIRIVPIGTNRTMEVNIGLSASIV